MQLPWLFIRLQRLYPISFHTLTENSNRANRGPACPYFYKNGFDVKDIHHRKVSGPLGGPTQHFKACCIQHGEDDAVLKWEPLSLACRKLCSVLCSLGQRKSICQNDSSKYVWVTPTREPTLKSTCTLCHHSVLLQGSSNISRDQTVSQNEMYADSFDLHFSSLLERN